MESRTYLGDKRDRVFTFLLASAVVIWAVTAVVLKVETAEAGAFTSDLYDFHTALRSTVEGAFFRSYVYGNVMGDHGVLALLLLVPMYWVSPSVGFWVLVLAAPVVAVISIVAVRAILVNRNYPYPNVISGSLLLIPGFFWLVHEPLYGFHPDTLAGPLLVVAAIGLDARQPGNKDLGALLGLVAFILFVTLKEEMALLGALFAIPFVIKPMRRRLGVALISIASLTALGAFWLMSVSRTPFNRGNETLISTAFQRLTFAEGFEAATGVALPMVIGVAMVAAAIGFRSRLSTAGLSLTLVVGVKVASLGLLYPSIPAFSWHLSIPICAFWYLLYRAVPDPNGVSRTHVTAGVAIAVLLVTGIVLVEGRWFAGYRESVSVRAASAAMAQSAFTAFERTVGNLVVSVPAHDIHAWRDREVTPLPRGVTLSPRGISDAVVTGSDGIAFTSQGVFDMHQIRTDTVFLTECFTLLAVTEMRELWVRTADCGLGDDRKLFDETVGLP